MSMNNVLASAVTQLEEEIAKLRKLGVDPGEPMSDHRARTVMIKDPDGNSIALVQTMARSAPSGSAG